MNRFSLETTTEGKTQRSDAARERSDALPFSDEPLLPQGAKPTGPGLANSKTGSGAGSSRSLRAKRNTPNPFRRIAESIGCKMYAA